MQVSYIVVEYSNTKKRIRFPNRYSSPTKNRTTQQRAQGKHANKLQLYQALYACIYVTAQLATADRFRNRPAGFETGRPASNPSTRFEAGARVVSASFDRTRLPRPFFTRVLDRSVSCERSLARYGVLLAASHSTREHIVSRLDFDTRLQ